MVERSIEETLRQRARMGIKVKVISRPDQSNTKSGIESSQTARKRLAFVAVDYEIPSKQPKRASQNRRSQSKSRRSQQRAG